MSYTDPVLPLLTEIVDIVEQSEVAIVQWVSPYLWRYGALLERQAQWACAHDVFCSTRGYAKAAADPWLTMWSALRAGPLARHLADLDAGDHTYTIAAQTARQINHQEGQLRARLGMARNVLSRHGDLSRAITVMHGLEAEARLYALQPFLSIVLHQLASLYFAKGHHYASVKLGMAARRLSEDADQIERIKGNTAASLVCLGHFSVARKINLSLVETAREEYIRHTALMNLLELAAFDRNRPLFEQYRQQLSDAPLTARARSTFHIFAGQGLHTFGQAAAAQEQLRYALAVAIEHQLPDILSIIRSNLLTVDGPTSTAVNGS